MTLKTHQDGTLGISLPGLLTHLCFDLADRGALHKAVILSKEVHVVEETQLFQDFEPVLTLLLSSKKVMWSRGQAQVLVSLGSFSVARTG